MAVLFLTANDLERDMLKGFELGAADYVSKPFPVKVLVKKVKTLLQLCSTRQEQPDGIYEDGELRIDLRSLRTVYHGKESSSRRWNTGCWRFLPVIPALCSPGRSCWRSSG